MRWYDPVSQRYIANYDDQANARAAAEAQLSATEPELGNERQARLAAEARIRELEKALGTPGEGQ